MELVNVAQVLSGFRVVQEQAFRIPAQAQGQHWAVPFENAVGFGGQGERLVLAFDQAFPGQRRAVQLAAGGVEPPILRDADLGIDVAFPGNVVPRRGHGSDFDGEIRRLAHFPRKVEPALPDHAGFYAECKVAIGANPDIKVPTVVADEGVAFDKEVGPVVSTKTGNQDGDEIEQVRVLNHGVR